MEQRSRACAKASLLRIVARATNASLSQKKGLLLKDRPGGGFRHAARPISAVARAAIGQRKRALPWPRVQRSLAQRPPARVPAPPCPPFGCLCSIWRGIGRAWPSPATSPAFPRPCVRWSPNGEGEGEGVAASCPARRPAASRLRRAPPWGRLQCPFGASAAPNGGVRLRPRRRHSRRGPWCARSLPPVPPVTGSYLSAARPSPSGRHLLPPV